MRVLFAGGGSGGHVTPLRAIAAELRSQSSAELELTVISDRAFFDQTRFLFKDDSDIHLRRIFSGKLRRYNGKSLLWHVSHLPTVLKNFRDIFLIGIGIVQSIIYFLLHKPDVVFCKGGYVCVPIGIAARLFQVPLVIHDSDTHPGLTNRFLSRWAVKIGTGMPTKYYQYDAEKMVYTGIPVNSGFRPFSSKDQIKTKKHLKLSGDKPVLLVTGGGTGAQELNNILLSCAQELLSSGWQILQVTGKGKAAKVRTLHESLPKSQQEAWQIFEFTEMLPLVTAADIIVSRSGATAMQEFANAKKPVITVPSPYLSGGHQLKNAAMFAENKAAILLHEVDLKHEPERLVEVLSDLKEKPQSANKLAAVLYEKFAKPEASKELAAMVLDQIRSV